MYINNHMRSVAGIYGAQGVGGATTKKSVAKAAHAGDVELSSQAQDFSSILRRICANTDSVRMDKVTELESQIAAGTYTVDSKAVAASMLDMRY